MFDIDTYNQINAEEKKYQTELRAQHNLIMGMMPGKRKTAAYRSLHGLDLAIEGLSKEDLERPW